MKKFTAEEITNILNKAEVETVELPTHRARYESRYRASCYCPNCGSADTWIIDIAQSKVKPNYEFYCQSCKYYFGKPGETEIKKQQKKMNKVREKMKQMDVHELEERESIGIYEEAILNLFLGKKNGITAYDVKRYFCLEPNENDKEIVFTDQVDAFQYLMILLSLREIESYFIMKDGV